MGCGASAKSTYEAKSDSTTNEPRTAAASDQAPSAASKAPPRDDERLSSGTLVTIEGLTGAVELNGKAAVVCGFNESAGRYVVELDGSAAQKSLKRENLRVKATTKRPPERKATGVAAQELPEKKKQDPPAKKEKEAKVPSRAPTTALGEFDVGERVRVGGLNGAIELNGQVAVIFEKDKASGRWLVEFENGAGQKRLKAENLTSMGNSTGPIAAKARMMAGIA